MIPISPNRAQIAENEEYTILGYIPSGFSYKNPQTISIFAERLKNLRMARAKEETPVYSKESSATYKRTKPKRYWTQERLALELGVSTMMVSKYENGNIEKVPQKHLRRICAFYGVTPHYLLGLVDDEHSTLDVNNSGEVQYKEDGKPRVLTLPMDFTPASFQTAINEYSELASTDSETFWLLNKLVVARGDAKDKCIKVLRILLGDS